ncbi:hypothetical protein Y1Q_0003244 [Alligator mississippiensis]|uniref:Uncharacterized protein n=1 Tax=Alligator mississippiensis TaxID=8496 RepID=A0A151ME32_ALLMI|nr:hypothetical protein Y1Q_0003244 [Alligator mississippiensis]
MIMIISAQSFQPRSNKQNRFRILLTEQHSNRSSIIHRTTSKHQIFPNPLVGIPHAGKGLEAWGSDAPA